MKQQFLQSKLLVIDDDPEILEMLWLLLSSAHYDVRTARDGAEGLQEMRREAPDMVILDLAMPRLNGAATLKEIRKRWGALPIILYTGLVDSELMKEAMEYSPFTLLAKPCTADQVLQTVHSLERSADTAVWKRNHHGLSKPVFH